MEFFEDIDAIIEAFDLMWSKYPEPAMLIHKSKKLVAKNLACRELGHDVSVICGFPEHQRDCLANEALATGKAIAVRREMSDGVEMTVYWLPLEGYEDYCVHFSSGSLPKGSL